MIYNAPRPIQAPDFLGATMAQANAANNIYAQKVARQNANKQGLFSLGAQGIQSYGPALAGALSSQAPAIGMGANVAGAGIAGAAGLTAAELAAATGATGAGAGLGAGIGALALL